MSSRLYFFIFILVVFFSCSEDDVSSITMGKNFIDSQSTIRMVDTFTVQMSTVLFDSIPTMGVETMLSGIYTDEYFGKVSCTGYFPVAYSDDNSTELLDEDAVYDSLSLVLFYTGVSYGDTLQAQEFNVHRVLEEIEENDDGYLYNVSSFPYSEEAIGTISVKPKPNFDEYLEIRLSDELGVAMYDSIQENSDFFDSSDDFQKFFYGLALVPGEENSAVLAFDVDSVQMVLYTHYNDMSGYKVEDSLKFQLDVDGGLNFNHVEVDRSGTDLADLTIDNNKIATSGTADRAFLQGSLGVATRLDFPGIATLLESDENYIFYKAEVVFYPVTLSNSQVDYPEDIVFYSTNKFDELVSEITASDGSTLTADFEEDEQYNEAYYTYEVTDYITDELSDSYYDSTTGLIILMLDEKYQGSLDRLVIDASPNSAAYRPKLKMYFLYYD